nr:chemotaxis response regulator protein-glutamate methylesterase [Afifella pfennigii]
MVVDDSAFIRGIVTRWIGEETGLAVVATHSNGRRAAEDVARSKPDVVILDIEMPEMDGLTALPLILKARPGTAVIMASTLTRRGAEVSIRALTLGASDYVPKPDSTNGLLSATDFRRDLLAKVRSLGAGVHSRARRNPGAPAAARPRAASPAPVQAAPAPAKPRLRPLARRPVKALLIGSSTGGPQALTQLLGAVGPVLAHVPVFLTQHMPPTFTAILAEHLSKASSRTAAEAKDGEVALPGRIYVAPGGRHMLLARSGSSVVLRLSDAPPINFCKPAVDPMFASAAEIYGAGTLALVLTGMGSDGAKGAVSVADAGGNVLVQDERSSVVWGMPGATVEAGACAEIWPIADLGGRVVRLLSGSH